jgi:hypothetical protein
MILTYQMCAKLLTQKILALGLIEKLTVLTEIGVFQRCMADPSKQCRFPSA